MFGGGERVRRPRLCPACGQLVGANQSRCTACGTSLTFSLAAASRSLAGILPEPHAATKIILSLTMLVFIVCLAATYSATGQLSIMASIPGTVLHRLGARSSYDLIVLNQWWRLVMPIFLHAGLMHIGFNMYALYQLGPPLEDLYGSARYLFLYIATGVCGFVFSTIWNLAMQGGFGIGIGASGAILGLAGLQLAVCSRRGGAYFLMVRNQLLSWVVIIFVMGLLPFFNVDNAAHFGGLVSGYVLGRIFTDREPAGPAERTRANLLGLLAILAIAGSFAAMLFHYSISLH